MCMYACKYMQTYILIGEIIKENGYCRRAEAHWSQKYFLQKNLIKILVLESIID